METKKILLAEDDPNDVELIITALEEYNLANQVDVVSDGAQALDYIYRRGEFASRPETFPVVILLDQKMPRVDGLEVLRQVKGDPNLKSIPIVMLTSSNQERDIRESYNLGANAFVVKPVAFQDFVEVIKKIGMFWVLTNEISPSITMK